MASRSIINTLKRIIPEKYWIILRQRLSLSGFRTWSYSQEGEDLILRRIFSNITNGFYVDIGAHHPKRFSNTYLFYRQGWCGINIDAMPGSMKLFNKFRPRDINLEFAVANGNNKMTYYEFNLPALNSFSKD
ncbi:MAG TPA: FkbM family methyltransferase, partial [Thermodesulfovibrionales bacterium]|nr:FkbM family methyltransferase [Thermodesulfovibrionales bacterium]